MQPPAKPQLHWIFRLLRALLLLGVMLAFLALLGIGLLSWGFYNTGQMHQRELEAKRRGVTAVPDTAPRPTPAEPGLPRR